MMLILAYDSYFLRLSSDSCQKGPKDSQPLRIMILMKKMSVYFLSLNTTSKYYNFSRFPICGFNSENCTKYVTFQSCFSITLGL